MVFSLVTSQLKWLYNQVDLFEMINYVWFELCNKLIVHDIILNVLFIYFLIILYFNMWSGGPMVRTLGCGQINEGSNLTLGMFCH
jgi:hypothetical protein